MPSRISESQLPEIEDDVDIYSLISINGFLPARQPLKRLPQAYYQPWEHMLDNLPTLLRRKALRREIDNLDILNTTRLDSEREWQRAYVILCFLAHGYIWGGDAPSKVRVPHRVLKCRTKSDVSPRSYHPASRCPFSASQTISTSHP